MVLKLKPQLDMSVVQDVDSCTKKGKLLEVCAKYAKSCMFGFGWPNLNEAIAYQYISSLKCSLPREAKKAGKPIKVMNQELYGSIL